ncbi:hypothetical protein ABH911_003114 [Pseudomonas protegens]|uniref:Uncharacterized protein n=1 Tax=Pseudomonas protegens (strain DSM 19095 / LMG 27888 / CFBP 6595 / CHA0) TaxID=1124983 RepID=A0A2C9EH64_PSEPH|nr:hypothetical protein [Pseudomonas protegens]AGL82929.1 hypothetical protein PFLCHA0_c11370 [Pseudomonas protegens CHA0]MBP5109915.1 hypothetical protein [Pseudomonas protegens]QTU25575.1 hypothetical protein HUT21_14830 [Pseudomonas protegens]QTU29210.1 hypothetical protein HUT20_01455 [Pseudomonas protegens]RLO25352.1 hypothetical protein EAG75_00755 [Pseudomonas protegens]
MEVLVILLLITGVITLLVVYANKRSAGNDLGITLDEAAQINRAAHLSAIEPQVGLQLAQRLTGKARQLGLFQMPAALYRQGHPEQALEVLAELDETYQPMALNQLLETLLDNDGPQAVLGLLERLHQPLPSAPLLRIPLLLAKGEHEQARALLVTFGVNQLSPDSPGEHRQLAALQRSLGLADEAAISIGLAWQLLLKQPVNELDPHEIEQTLREYRAQGQDAQFPAMAAQLPGSARIIVVTLLMETGEFEAGFELLAQAPEPEDYFGYPPLLKLILDANRPDLAPRLIAQIPESYASDLLLSLLNWHVGRNEMAEAEAALQACAVSPSQRIWCLVCLWGTYVEEHSQWCAHLLEQALLALETLRGDEQWPWLRLLILETQLRVQADLPRLRRDSWLIRNNLEEMARLNTQLEYADRPMKLALQAKLLHDLEQTRQAGELLDQAVQALDDSQNAPLDPAEKNFFLEQLALSYVYIDDQEKAVELKARLEQQAAYTHQLSQAMVLKHIHEQRFDEAIAGLEPSNLFIGENPVQQLHLALETLRQSAPEKAQGLCQKLIDHLAAESAWGQPNAA